MTSDPRIDRLEGVVEELRDEVHGLRADMNSRFNSLETRMTTIWVGVVGAMTAGFITLFVAILLTR